MNLLKDTTFHTELTYESDRILINSGSQIANSLNGQSCHSNTFLPKNDWRLLSKQEEQLVFSSSEEISSYQQIGIIKLPESLIAEINRTAIRNVTNYNNTNEVKNSPLTIETLNKIEDYCKQFQIVEEKQIGIGLIYRPATADSSTYDRFVKSYIGLHLDSWEHDNIPNRKFSRNRICFNLGNEDRYITFCNLELSSMASLISDKEKTKIPREVIKIFLNENKEYPILKIKIKPFEGYIFPTENLIHDGRNSLKSKIDITFTLRSYYKVSLLN